jgi:hypothetical protein
MADSLPWDNPEKLREMYHGQKMSLSDIADEWPEATRSKIRWQFKKHDIDTRSRGEGKRIEAGADVSISLVRGRYRLEFREFGEHRQFPLARLIAMADYSLEELAGKHVHHKNGHSIDDRRENLEVLNASDHHSEHAPNDAPDYSAERRREIAQQRERDENGRFV